MIIKKLGDQLALTPETEREREDLRAAWSPFDKKSLTVLVVCHYQPSSSALSQSAGERGEFTPQLTKVTLTDK